MRIVNRLASILLALVLLAAGLAILAQIVSASVDKPWPVPASWRRTLADLPLSDRRVLIASVVVAAVGLIALVAQLVPRRQRRLPVVGAGSSWWVSRRSVERRSEAAALGGGARHTRAVAHGNPQQWQVRISGEAPPHRRADVEQSVRDELAILGAPQNVDLSLSLRQPGRVG